MSLAGSAAVIGVTGPLAERWGTSAMLARSLGAWSVAVALLAVARPPWLLGPACAIALGLGGAVDVAMNVAASAAFADEPGRLVRFHARFNPRLASVLRFPLCPTKLRSYSHALRSVYLSRAYRPLQRRTPLLGSM